MILAVMASGFNGLEFCFQRLPSDRPGWTDQTY